MLLLGKTTTFTFGFSFFHGHIFHACVVYFLGGGFLWEIRALVN